MGCSYISLGSNIGNRSENLIDAINLIKKHSMISIIKKSSIMETEPVDYLKQPKFLNQIILIKTDLYPEKLLGELNKIEIELGKNIIIPKGPRIIDLDILLYDNQIIKSKKLNIPHPEIKNRQFIIKLLVELNPKLADPLTKKKYKNF